MAAGRAGVLQWVGDSVEAQYCVCDACCVLHSERVCVVTCVGV
jgi:hypothetical protein